MNESLDIVWGEKLEFFTTSSLSRKDELPGLSCREAGRRHLLPAGGRIIVFFRSHPKPTFYDPDSNPGPGFVPSLFLECIELHSRFRFLPEPIERVPIDDRFSSCRQELVVRLTFKLENQRLSLRAILCEMLVSEPPLTGIVPEARHWMKRCI